MGLFILENTPSLTKQAFLICMAGNALQEPDLRGNIDLFPEDLHAFCSVVNDPAECAGCLITSKHHGVLFIPQIVFQMMTDPAAFAHPAGCNDDLGFRICIQSLGFLRGYRRMQSVKPDRIASLPHDLKRFIVQAFLRTLQENSCGFIGQRAVHIYREVLMSGQQSFLLDLTEKVQEFLGPADSERRDKHGSAAVKGGFQDIEEYRNRIMGSVVVPCTVGRFDQQIIRILQRLWVFDDRLVQIPDITAANKLPALSFLFKEKLNKR